MSMSFVFGVSEIITALVEVFYFIGGCFEAVTQHDIIGFKVCNIVLVRLAVIQRLIKKAPHTTSIARSA